MMPLDTSSTTAAWIASIAALIAVFISIVALVYARKEANATGASAKSAEDSADEARRANELAERAEQRAVAATEVNRYRWEVVHYENEAYRLFNFGTDVAHEVTMTINYPDEWVLDLPTNATIAPRDWHKFRVSLSLSPEMPDFVLIGWREHPEPLRVPLPPQHHGKRQ